MSARPIPTPGAITGTTSTRDPDDWRARAACRDQDGELFFAAEGERSDGRPARVAQAQAICATCPVKSTCYADAVETLEQYAVRGGVDFSILGLRTIYHWRDALRKTAA
jgi:WhiB family redox-sensing transcriptional regulator